MSQIMDLCVPDIGDYRQVPVIEIMVAVGDTIAIDTPVLTLESDKATMEVPSTISGKVTGIALKIGDLVSEGSVILRVDANTAKLVETTPVAPSQHISDLPAATSQSISPIVTSTVFSSNPISSPCGPSVRRLARELGVDLNRLVGSGPKGRIQREDVIALVKTTMRDSAPSQSASPRAGCLDLLPWPHVDFEQFGPVERRLSSRIQKISAANLHRNWVMIPHVTNFDEVDITELEAFRQQINSEHRSEDIKVTLLAFIIKAVVATLQAQPAFNSALDGDEVILKKYWHIGFAADTPDGLVVPVIRDADKKTVLELARESTELAKLARSGKLKPAQMEGGCFTISSLGGIGSTGFTPIINAPEVATLGVARSSIKPIWNGESFMPRLVLPLCLSWDHRVVDGVAAARFLVHMSRLLADIRRTML